MSIGMTYDQYWYGDVRMVQDYLKAYEMRMEREREQINFSAYLHGFYTYQAVARLAPILRTSFSKRRIEARPYMDAPIELSGGKKESEMTAKEKDAKEEKELQFARAYMMQMDMAGKSWGES